MILRTCESENEILEVAELALMVEDAPPVEARLLEGLDCGVRKDDGRAQNDIAQPRA